MSQYYEGNNIDDKEEEDFLRRKMRTEDHQKEVDHFHNDNDSSVSFID